MRRIIEVLRKKKFAFSVYKTLGITTCINVTCEGMMYRVTRGLPKHYILWAFSVSDDDVYYLEGIRYCKSIPAVLKVLNKRGKKKAEPMSPLSLYKERLS